MASGRLVWFDLSTTTGSTPQYLTDFGNTVVPGTTTHHLTLYRASSGALMFGAGTIQWGWGLDQEHERRQQQPARSAHAAGDDQHARDMHTLPTTLIERHGHADAVTDTQAPTVTNQ